MAYNPKAVELANLIEANRNCQFDIDNDNWYMVDPSIENGENGDENEIANSRSFSFDTDWYSNSELYGSGIAEALVILLNRRGFNIKAEAV